MAFATNAVVTTPDGAPIFSENGRNMVVYKLVVSDATGGSPALSYGGAGARLLYVEADGLAFTENPTARTITVTMTANGTKYVRIHYV